MEVPVVTIVGRPNVGKSSLFNALAERRIAIVDAEPGVTRDRVSTIIKRRHFGQFELVDTGGMGIVDRADLTEEIREQIDLALQKADVILFVVNVREGLTALDQEGARRLRSLAKPVIVVANKAEKPSARLEALQFFELGYGEPVLTSAREGMGLGELLERTLKILPKPTRRVSAEEPVLKIAIVGKRNTGKSSLVNFLAQEKRVLVSSTPGTTRDAIDVRYQRDGKTYLAIDTAGVRKKRSVQDSVEFYSLARTDRSVRRAEVVLLMLDATTEISKVDKKIASLIVREHKPCVIAVNKWDLVPQAKSPEEYRKYIGARLAGMGFAPISFMSTIKGWHVWETLELAEELARQAKRRIPTAQVNRLISEALTKRPPRSFGKVTPRIYYGSQVAVEPPRFVFFANNPNLFTPHYRHYLENFIRSHSEISEVPIVTFFRERLRQAPRIKKASRLRGHSRQRLSGRQ